MQNEQGIDPIGLQRLIDGELSAIEIRELLQRADEDPSQWRTIGCAFAEDQLFRKQFESLTEDNPKPSRPAKPAPAKIEMARPSSMPLVRNLVTAACFALAGLVGYLIGNDSRTQSSDMPSNTNMIASDDTVAPAMTPVDLKPEYRMQLLTADGESVDGEVDLYRYNDLNQIVGNDDSDRQVTWKDILPASGFSPQARQRLSQSGYEINESNNYMSGRLQDGRQFVVPVRSIRFDQGH